MHFINFNVTKTKRVSNYLKRTLSTLSTAIDKYLSRYLFFFFFLSYLQQLQTKDGQVFHHGLNIFYAFFIQNFY